MNINRKLAFFVMILLFLFAIAYIIISYAKKEEPIVPVSYDFNNETGDVTFTIHPDFEIYDITLEVGSLQEPSYNSTTRHLSFQATELDVGKHEVILFRCSRIGTNPVEIVSTTYEILSQSDSELIIMRYYLDFLKDTQTYTYHLN